MLPRAPASEVRRLRRLVSDPSLEIHFDARRTRELGCQVWNVYYRTLSGSLTWLVEWPHELDGNIEPIASMIRNVDFRHTRPKDYSERLDRRTKRLREARQKRVDDRIADAVDYMAPAVRAYLEGKPSVGRCDSYTTGRA